MGSHQPCFAIFIYQPAGQHFGGFPVRAGQIHDYLVPVAVLAFPSVFGGIPL